MVDKNFIDNLANLYENIFHESAVESKELLIFAQEGNIHPLRVKVEEYLNYRIKDVLSGDDKNKHYKLLEDKNSIFELDALITDYIETNV